MSTHQQVWLAITIKPCRHCYSVTYRRSLPTSSPSSEVSGRQGGGLAVRRPPSINHRLSVASSSVAFDMPSVDICSRCHLVPPPTPSASAPPAAQPPVARLSNLRSSALSFFPCPVRSRGVPTPRSPRQHPRSVARLMEK